MSPVCAGVMDSFKKSQKISLVLTLNLFFHNKQHVINLLKCNVFDMLFIHIGDSQSWANGNSIRIHEIPIKYWKPTWILEKCISSTKFDLTDTFYQWFNIVNIVNPPTHTPDKEGTAKGALFSNIISLVLISI